MSRAPNNSAHKTCSGEEGRGRKRVEGREIRGRRGELGEESGPHRAPGPTLSNRLPPATIPDASSFPEGTYSPNATRPGGSAPVKHPNGHRHPQVH